MAVFRRLCAEFIGTFWLVFAGCGSAVLAARFDDVGIGLVGVSPAFGLSGLTMAYALGHLSGGHFNPAVTVGRWLGRRFAVTNTSVNPARSTGPALFVGGSALARLWLFWLAPLIGAVLAGLGYRFVAGDTGAEAVAAEAQDPGTAEVAIGELGHPPAGAARHREG